MAGPGTYQRIYRIVKRIPAGRVATYGQVARLAGMPGHGRPATYILTRDAEGQPDGFDGAADRARELGWPVTVMIGSHTPYRDQLAEVVALLVRVAGGVAP